MDLCYPSGVDMSHPVQRFQDDPDDADPPPADPDPEIEDQRVEADQEEAEPRTRSARSEQARTSSRAGQRQSAASPKAGQRQSAPSPKVRKAEPEPEGEDDTEAAGEADMLSYLLFDGEFATELLELGFQDAKAQEDELLKVFGPG